MKVIIFKRNNSSFFFLLTSTIRAFGLGCFLYSAPVPEPKHIGARSKGMTFGLECGPNS